MQVKVFKTIKGKEPLQESPLIQVNDDKGIEKPVINIVPQVEYQEIEGFGGAFTEAAAKTLDKLGKENREKILKLYFSEDEGIGYNFGRVHMNSCDFSESNYSCVDENDETLDSFNIDRDKQSFIPMIKDAMKYGDIRLFMSPWSPPAYMKTNGEMNHGGKLKDEYRELWSDFYVKFIEAYKKEGISIWGITVQNEPKAVQKWDSCVYTAEEERDFVKEYLGEKMDRLGVKIMFWDHNKERIMDRALVMMSDKEAAKYIYGLAFHWYSGDHFEQLEMFNRLYPDKKLIFSEGCYEYSLGITDTIKIGERYAHDMIGNFNNFCTMFCDWNLLLDEKGGPNHVGNFCDAPIMADTKNDKVYIRDSYYYIGHFSKFVKKGAKRIGCSKWTDNLETVSFKNPDGTIVSIVLNRTEKNIPFTFRLLGKTIETISEAHSIGTYIFSL
ncbi:MAG: glycoside hydrolase family 30 protein [Lachnospiraceae bacterium]|nr:glycoside hydrolase family 30 protein [Lachnospiraceae bacterium]